MSGETLEDMINDGAEILEREGAANPFEPSLMREFLRQIVAHRYAELQTVMVDLKARGIDISSRWMLERDIGSFDDSNRWLRTIAWNDLLDEFRREEIPGTDDFAGLADLRQELAETLDHIDGRLKELAAQTDRKG